MSTDEQHLDMEPEIIVLGLAYATSLLTLIGWVATL